MSHVQHNRGKGDNVESLWGLMGGRKITWCSLYGKQEKMFLKLIFARLPRNNDD